MKWPTSKMAPTLKVVAFSGFRLGLPKMRTARKVPPMFCNEVTLPGSVWLGGGARNVVPTEPRRAKTGRICHLARPWGLKVEPTPPP